MVLYINEHLMDNLRLIDIARVAGYSPWHLCELFKNHTGKPIMKYIREEKIKSASKETTSNRRLYDIAMDYGFETQAGFYKAFNAVIGCTPLEYKNHELRGINNKNIELINKIILGADIMENVIIREVKQTDAKDLWENIYSRNTPEEVEERVANSIRKMQSGEGIHLVAEVDGVVIGNMLLKRETHPLYAHKCSLDDVVVNPAFQGMGIAKSLFNECKNVAVRKGLKLVTVSCRGGTPAEEVYKKLGFIEAGRIPNGIIESWGDMNTFDEIYFYQEL